MMDQLIPAAVSKASSTSRKISRISESKTYTCSQLKRRPSTTKTYRVKPLKLKDVHRRVTVKTIFKIRNLNQVTRRVNKIYTKEICHLLLTWIQLQASIPMLGLRYRKCPWLNFARMTLYKTSTCEELKINLRTSRWMNMSKLALRTAWAFQTTGNFLLFQPAKVARKEAPTKASRSTPIKTPTLTWIHTVTQGLATWGRSPWVMKTTPIFWNKIQTSGTPEKSWENLLMTYKSSHHRCLTQSSPSKKADQWELSKAISPQGSKIWWRDL